MPKTTLIKFKDSLFDPDQFTLTFELIPSRGGKTKEQQRIVDLAARLARDARLQAVSITENAGGHPALSPEMLGLEIKRMGLDVITHFSCKDKNRNQMESQLFSWDREGLANLLVITGDYPKKGFQGYPKPVFDLDSVQALRLISRMNTGRFDGYKSDAPGCRFAPTGFLKGVAVSPFKLTAAEQLMQYYKLHRKVNAGADYIITQLGYDARKFHELLQYLRASGLALPVLGNVFIPNLPVARLMHAGEIPGCVLGDDLLRQMEHEADSPDRGRGARLARAAKLLCVLEGIGYQGAHLGGPGLSYDDIDQVLSRMEEWRGNWRDFLPELAWWPAPESYLYARDAATGLNSAEEAARPSGGCHLHTGYRLARFVHDLAFEKGGLLYEPARRFCLALDGTRLEGGLGLFEHFVKFLAFGCENCGDCTLAELAFLCPQSRCAKYMLNGPCGGSRDGWCEVFPGKRRCLYVLWHERAAACGFTDALRRGYVPPRNWQLSRTSSWVNFYRGRDHAACREEENGGEAAP
ncbi:MAG: methylenetetrahydrofolate reductase C-terminal domain-containing protein [Thermodesulfobacteriota bacterium]